MHNSRRIHRIASSLSHGGIVGGALSYHEQSHRSDCHAAINNNNSDNNDNIINNTDNNDKEIIIVNNKTSSPTTSPLNALVDYDELFIYDYFKETVPPSDIEIESATDRLLESDDNIFERIVPGLGSTLKKEAIKYIKNLDFNELAIKTRETIENAKPSYPEVVSIDKSLSTDEFINIQSDGSESDNSLSRTVSPEVFTTLGTNMVQSSWESLRHDYPCAICQDVLAAPVLMEPCSHSFCGECMTDFWNAKAGVSSSSSSSSSSSIPTTTSSSWLSSILNFFNPDSEDDYDEKIVFTCPECRMEILNNKGIFNNLLDRDIARRVTLVKECTEKRDWTIRRNDYINKKKRKEKFDNNDNNNCNNSDNILSYQQVFDKFIPLIAIAIMAIIYLVRKK